MRENVQEVWEEFFQQKVATPEYKVERWSAFHAPNAAMLRYTLESEGFDCFQWSDQPGMYYGLHQHGEEQSHWIVSGQIEIHVRGAGTFQLGPGDRDFMPANTFHSARVIGDEPVVYFIGIKRPEPSKPAASKPKRRATAKGKPREKPSTKPSKAGSGKEPRKSASNPKSSAKPSTRRSKTSPGKAKAKEPSKKKAGSIKRSKKS